MAPPSHVATQSIFFCDEANRVSHFMLEHAWTMSMALPAASQKNRANPIRTHSAVEHCLWNLRSPSSCLYGLHGILEVQGRKAFVAVDVMPVDFP